MEFFIFLCYIANFLLEISAVPPSTTPISRQKEAIRTSKTAELINFVNSMYNGDALAFLRSHGNQDQRRRDEIERRHFAKGLQQLLGGAYDLIHLDKSLEGQGYQALADNVRYHVIDNPEVLEEYFRKQKMKTENKKRMKRLKHPTNDESVSLDYYAFNSMEKKEQKKYYKRRFDEFGELENLEPENEGPADANNPTDMIDQLIPKSEQDVTFQPSFPDDEEEETPAAEDIDMKIREIDKEDNPQQNEQLVLVKSTENEQNKEEFGPPQKQVREDIKNEEEKPNDYREESVYKSNSFKKEEHTYKEEFQKKQGNFDEKAPSDKREEYSNNGEYRESRPSKSEGSGAMGNSNPGNRDPREEDNGRMKDKEYKVDDRQKKYRHWDESQEQSKKDEEEVKTENPKPIKHISKEKEQDDKDWPKESEYVQHKQTSNEKITTRENEWDLRDKKKKKNRYPSENNSYKNKRNDYDEVKVRKRPEWDVKNVDEEDLNRKGKDKDDERANKDDQRGRDSDWRNKKDDREIKKDSRWDNQDDWNKKDKKIDKKDNEWNKKDNDFDKQNDRNKKDDDFNNKNDNWNKKDNRNDWNDDRQRKDEDMNQRNDRNRNDDGPKKTRGDSWDKKNDDWDRKDSNRNKKDDWDKKDDGWNKKDNDWNKKDNDWNKKNDDWDRKDSNRNKKDSWNKKDDDWNKKDNDWNKKDNDWNKKDNDWNKKDNDWNKKDNDWNKKDSRNKKDDWTQDKKSDNYKKPQANNDWDKVALSPKPDWGQYDVAKKNIKTDSLEMKKNKKGDDYGDDNSDKPKKKKSSWDSYVPKIDDYYQPKKIKRHDSYERPRNNQQANFGAFGRTPIPFAGKKRIYADK